MPRPSSAPKSSIRRLRILCAATSSILAIVCAGQASAELTPSAERVLPDSFPVYFQDGEGLALQLCTANNDISGLCIYDPPLIGNTFSENLGFGPEAFWWAADASIDLPTGGSAGLVLAVEAAFSNEFPVPGDEFTFGRVRIRIDTPQAGTYTVVHPYGQETFEVGAGETINTTGDIGTFAPDFSGPSKSAITQYLRWPAGPDVPLGYIGDPAVPHVVEGSPTGHNRFTVIYNGIIEGWPTFVGEDNVTRSRVETDLFNLSGMQFTGTTPVPITVRRATYDGLRVELFVRGPSKSTIRTTIDNVPLIMYGDGTGNFYLSAPALTKPASIDLVATNAGNSPTNLKVDVVDTVDIRSASFNPTTGILAVVASSTVGAPLVLEQGNVALVDGTANVSGIKVPPHAITVRSAEGGKDTEPVVVTASSPTGTDNTTTPPPSDAPSAVPDTATGVINTALLVDVLANDGDANGIDATSLAVASPPVILGTGTSAGTIGLIGPQGITFIPALNFLGTATFTYTVKDTLGTISAPTLVTVHIGSEDLNVVSAECRTRNQSWRISGSSNATSQNTISAFPNGSTTAAGSGDVDTLGDFDIRFTAPCTANSTLVLKSSKGTVLSGVPVLARR